MKKVHIKVDIPCRFDGCFLRHGFRLVFYAFCVEVSKVKLASVCVREALHTVLGYLDSKSQAVYMLYV